MSTGVGAAIINMALNLGITAKTVALVGAIVTSVPVSYTHLKEWKDIFKILYVQICRGYIFSFTMYQ